MYKVLKPPPKPMPWEIKYHHKRHGTGTIVNAWAMIYGMTYVYGKAIGNTLDWFGEKLVYLIDHSDFFAGAVVGVLISEICYLFGK